MGAERSSSAGRRRKRKKRRKKRTLEPRHTYRMAALVVDIGSGMFLAGVLVSVLPTLCSLRLTWFFWEMTSGKWWSVLVPCLWIHAHASVYVVLRNFTLFLRLHGLGYGFPRAPGIWQSLVQCLPRPSCGRPGSCLRFPHRQSIGHLVLPQRQSTVQFCVGCCHARCCVRQVRKGQTVQKTVEVPQLLQFP